MYTGIEDSDNYDHIYQSDLCGWVGQLGYNKESIYGANVYTAESNQNLTVSELLCHRKRFGVSALCCEKF
ncbi:MAG: lectin like domain-containing protein [Roseburia inulinivorans]